MGQSVNGTNSELMTRGQCSQWMEKHGFEGASLLGFPFESEIVVPERAGRQAALVYSIRSWRPRNGQCLVRVTDYGIGELENFDLFERVRMSFGLTQSSLDQHCGFTFGLEIDDALESVLAVSLYNQWDVFLGDDQHRFKIKTSHHGFILLACEEGMREELQGITECFGGKKES